MSDVDVTDVTTVISQENYSEKIKLLEKKLVEFELKQKEIMTAVLLVEEVFLCFQRVYSNHENFSVNAALTKQSGSINILISVKDAQGLNPLKGILGISIKDDTYWNACILKANINKLKYSRKNDENIITIRVHKSGSSTVRKTLTGLISGLIIGYVLKIFVSPDVNKWLIENIFDSMQLMFINALMMLVAPMIFFTVIDGIAGISDSAVYIERIGKRLIIFSLLKLAFYVVLGLAAGFIIGKIPGFSSIVDIYESSPQPSNVSISNFIVGIIPSSAASPFNENNILQLLFLACLFGIFLNRGGENRSLAKKAVKFMSNFMIDILGAITSIVPFLVTISTIEIIIKIGFQAMYNYIRIILMSAGCLFISFIVASFLISIIGKILPSPFFRKIIKFSVLPFSLSSSSACLPYELSFCSQKLGLDEKVAKFSIPVGMQLNMDGTAFYVSVISMMLVRTLEIDINAGFLVSLFLIEFSIALTGIGLIAAPPMLSPLGIPQAAIIHFVGIEPILDMFGTAQSVIGNITSSFVVSRL